MTSWVVIHTQGKQYKVSEGQVLDVDRLVAKSDTITFDKIMLASDGKNLKVGTPYLDKARVTGNIVNDFRAKKIRVVKFKSKSRYTRTTGHRQDKTRVRIETISI